MDILSGTMRENEAQIITGWVQALGKITGEPFGGTVDADPYKETRIAYQAILAILEKNDRKPADEQAARLARLPALRGAGVTATIRGYYALFEALRPVLTEAYAGGREESLPHDVERLRSAVGLMTSILTAEHFAQHVAWQNDWDRMAFHGLRAPVTRTLSELQALQTGAGDNLPHAFREMLRDAVRAMRQLLGIVESLFALHRLGEGATAAKPESTPLATLLNGITEETNKRATDDRKTIAWAETPAGSWVLADRDFVPRALALVLARAIDETESGGTVRVETSADSGRALVAVRHQSQEPPPAAGAPEPIEYVFARLALEHLGGRVEVTRDPGKVVSVVFRFPPATAGSTASQPGAAGAAKPTAPPAAAAGIRIVRTGQSTPEPAQEPEDPSRGGIKIVRGSIAPETPPGDQEEKIV